MLGYFLVSVARNLLLHCSSVLRVSREGGKYSLSHQRQIIEDHSPLELTRTLMQKHNWPQDNEHITFLPFGLLCLRGMANKEVTESSTNKQHHI